ncbi:hypothetical protein ACQCT5_06915 [Sutcliffiella halmapala]
MKKILSNIKSKISKAGTNSKELIRNITGSFLIKGLAMIVSLFTMPAYMSYFTDQAVLGIWFTLISMLNWILSFDLGIGNGLRNKLVKPLVEKDDEKVKKYISSAYIILGIISGGLTIVGYICIGLLNWNNIMKISPDILTNSTLILAVRFLFIGIMLQFFLRIIVSILYALQKTVLPSILTLITTLSILTFMMIYKGSDMSNNIIILSIVNILAVNIPLLATTVVLFITKLRKSIPSYKSFVKNYAYNIMKLGGVFFWIQIMFMVITSTNPILITQFYGPENVVEYLIYYKLFYLFVTLFSLITNPIWSAVSKAYAENNFTWLKKVYKYLNLVLIVGIFACLILTVFLQVVVNLWLGSNSITVSYSFGMVFAIHSGVMMYILAITSIANGVGNLKPQLICYTIAAVLKIPLIYLVSLYNDSWLNVVIINIVVMLPFVIIQSIIIFKLINKNQQKVVEAVI